MSLWRPIMCRTSQMFPPPPRSDPTSTAPYLNNSSDHPAVPGSTGAYLNNNNNNNKNASKCDPSTPSPLGAPTSNSESFKQTEETTTVSCYLWLFSLFLSCLVVLFDLFLNHWQKTDGSDIFPSRSSLALPINHAIHAAVGRWWASSLFRD